MKKNILFVFNGLVKIDDKVGVSGGDIRVSEIIKNIDKNKYNIGILTTTNGDDFINKFNIPYNEKHIINYSINGGILSNLIICIKSFLFLPNSLKNYNYDIVYSSCEHLYDVLPCLRLKIFKKCYWYAVYHWVENYPWKDKRGDTSFIRRYVYWLNRFVSGLLIKFFSDKILAVSDQTKSKLISIKHIDPEKIKAVYCGVEYNSIIDVCNKFSNEKGKVYDAVYMKRLDNGKGIFDLLKIWKLVCDFKKDATLAIIGDGLQDIVNNINEFISINKLSNNIFILGLIYDFEEKFRVLNSAKIFVLPTMEENWAIVIGEAMAAKIPVICYNLKEIVPIWEDNVEWIEFRDIDQFAKIILLYLGNENKRLELSNKAFKFVGKYSWKDIAINELVL